MEDLVFVLLLWNVALTMWTIFLTFKKTDKTKEDDAFWEEEEKKEVKDEKLRNIFTKFMEEIGGSIYWHLEDVSVFDLKWMLRHQDDASVSELAKKLGYEYSNEKVGWVKTKPAKRAKTKNKVGRPRKK